MIIKIKDIKVKVYEIVIKVITLLLFLKILLVSFATLANSDDNFISNKEEDKSNF